MSLSQNLKDFFVTKQANKQPNLSSAAIPDFDSVAYTAAHEAYMTKHHNDIESESKRFIANYGEFDSFLSTPQFDVFLRKDVLFFREPENEHNTFLDKDHWQEKHPFNFPGPFYAGYSDSCGTGVCEAPRNVMNDANCREYVFRQPEDFTALLYILDAAAVEVFDSYSSNGNDYWTYELCREWWSNRAQLIVALRDEELVKMNDGQAQAYINYLNGEAELDLRRYCYFLLNGTYPIDENTVLPSL